MFFKKFIIIHLKLSRHVIFNIYIYTFLSPCKLCTLCIFWSFSLTRFCFDEYLSYILTFAPHYCDCLCDTFWRPFENQGSISISISSYILVSASTLQNCLFLLQNFFEKTKHLRMIQLLYSIIWQQYQFAIITHFSMIFFSSIQRHPLVF